MANVIVMATLICSDGLLVMASTLIAMANLIAMASTLIYSDGKPSSDGLHPNI